MLSTEHGRSVPPLSVRASTPRGALVPRVMFGQPKRDASAASKDAGSSKNAKALPKGGANGAKNDPKGTTGKKQPAKTSGKQTAEPAEDRQLVPSKRVTPPKNRPTPTTGAKGRPAPKSARPQSKSSRPKSNDA